MVNKSPPEELETWSLEVEKLLCEWSEKASCYRWLYNKSEKKYRRRYYLFSIPVIILSTLTGAVNVGLNTYVPESGQKNAQAIVGGVNIFAGILSTLQNFLKVAEIMESNRSAGVSWSKLGRNISIELAIDPSRRENCHDFLAICRAEYDRLIEQSPTIDDDVIDTFKKKFKTYKVCKPAITNGLDKCDIYKKEKSSIIENEEDLNNIRLESGEEEALTPLAKLLKERPELKQQLTAEALSTPPSVTSKGLSP